MQIVKKKIDKFRLTVILSFAFVLLVAIAIVLGVVLLGGEEAPGETVKPEILEGEDIYYNMAIAYPAIKETDIQMISVKNKTGKYDLMRPDGGGSMIIYYTDKNGDVKAYKPSILKEENMDYDNLYAIEMNDSYKSIFKLTYLCIALEIPYFEERIILSSDPDERTVELREYGLTNDKATTVLFTYKDEGGAEKAHTVTIGAKNINGNGYYFMVDDREYVYTSQNNHYDYAMMGFESFIKSTLVAAGLPVDNGQEPLLTTNFYEWINEMHKEEGEAVEKDSTVVMYLDTLYPKNDPENGSDSSSYGDGYYHTGYKQEEFLLSKYVSGSLKRMSDLLVGKKTGVYFDTTSQSSSELDQIIVTLTSRLNEIDFGSSQSKKYTYEIYKIESILTDNGEICDTGTVVGSNNLIKAAYNLYIDDKPSGSGYYGVFDLGEGAFSDSSVKLLRESAVGNVGPFNLEVNYTSENSVAINVKYVVTEIVAIQNASGASMNRVTDKSIVSYKFKILKNGEVSAEEEIAVVDFNEDTPKNAKAYEALKGETAGKNKDIIINEYDAYCQYVYDFITYKIASIDYFVTSKLVSAFRFQNASKRDPYYGESLYENLMQDENKLYGLDSGACESVVQILGGIASDSTANTADGFYGSETVAVGLTPEIKKHYGLYAYTVYFELPRQIYVSDGTYSDTLDDYDSAYTIGFTLYISEEKPDGTRYVASDMYDVVTKIDSEKLDFLNYDFVSFWARRDLIMMDVKYIENIGVEFNMTDVYGAYDFKLNHEEGKTQSGSPFHKITVNTTILSENSGNLFTDYVKGKQQESSLYDDFTASLTEFYNYALGDKLEEAEKESSPDSPGTAEFKQIIRMIYLTGYQNLLTKEEQAEILRDGELLMTLSFKVRENKYNNGNRYVYEFYRNDDRRVMVRLYQADADGNMKSDPVSDFYISTFAFKKIVRNFNGLLNGEILDPNVGYAD